MNRAHIIQPDDDFLQAGRDIDDRHPALAHMAERVQGLERSECHRPGLYGRAVICVEETWLRSRAATSMHRMLDLRDTLFLLSESIANRVNAKSWDNTDTLPVDLDMTSDSHDTRSSIDNEVSRNIGMLD